MSLSPYSDEELYYFKWLSLVLNEFPKALRQIFKSMWDTTIGHRRGFQSWDDSTTVRNLFLYTEGGATKVPTHLSYNEWDCTALFQATIFAKCFSVFHRTLYDLYVVPKAVPPRSFHGSVWSSRGVDDETIALAIDQLRRLRNSVCHSSRAEMDKATFDRNIQYAKEAFEALGASTALIDAIGSLTASDFPTTEVRELERQAREVNAQMGELNDSVANLTQNLTALEKDVHEIKKREKERDIEAEKADNRPPVLKSDLCEMVPNFIGRQSECQEIVALVSSEQTQIVSICGSPVVGKTSVGIVVGHQLQSRGFPVCFLPLQGLHSKADLTLKLFSFVRQPTTSQRSVPQPLFLEDELLETLSNISDCSVFILDNVDDLLESGFPNVKEDVHQLFKEIITRNEKITLVLTTRESFEFMDFYLPGHKSIRIGPLDDTSSHALVRELMPTSSPADCVKIGKICGGVPLAIKLMCRLVCGDDGRPSQRLIESMESETESIVDILDNPDYLDNQRLQFQYKKSLQRLSHAEKEAFVSLSILPKCFTPTLAKAVLNVGMRLMTIKMLKLLGRKSLLDSNSQSGTFTMHKLLQSFAKKTGEQCMKETLANAKRRFHAHYISRFEELNDDFLNGRSKAAFIEFYEEKQFFVESLVDGCTDPRIAEDVFKVLIKAEMFLDSLFWCPIESHNFDNIYDSALQAATDDALGRAHYQRCLLASKAFREITWGAKGSAIQLLQKAWEMQSTSCPFSNDERGKYLCYVGMCKLVIGKVKTGITRLEEALSLLRGSGEQKILRLVVFQVLAVYCEFSNDLLTSACYRNNACRECNSAEEKLIVIPPHNGDKLPIDTCNLGNWPMQFLVIYHVREVAKSFFDTDTKQFIINPALQILNDIQINSKTPFHLLHFYGNVMALLGSIFAEEGIVGSGFEESVARHEANLEQFKHSGPEENVVLNVSSEECNHPLAGLYLHLGELHHSKRNYRKAHDFKKCALDIQLRTNRQTKAFLAHSFHSLWLTQQSLGDFESALLSEKQALDVRKKLFGEDHGSTADSYDSLGVTQHSLGDFTSALQSKKRALDVRIKLFGEDHARTADSYHSLGVTQHSLGYFTSALQSHQRALDVRIKWFGEDHGSTAESYHSLRVAQHSLGDLTPALQSH